jgi:hypothetical protein
MTDNQSQAAAVAPAMQEWMKEAERLAMDFAHAYSFVGDDTMPKAKAALLAHLRTVPLPAAPDTGALKQSHRELRELLREAGEIIDGMASWFRNQPMGCPPAGTAQLQWQIPIALARASEVQPAALAQPADMSDSVLCLTELMRGLEIPPGTLSPSALYHIGAAIARQAKGAAQPAHFLALAREDLMRAAAYLSATNDSPDNESTMDAAEGDRIAAILRKLAGEQT